MHEVVEREHVVGGSLGKQLVIRQRQKHGAILVRRRVDVRVEVVVAEVRVLGRESVDELVACVSHAVSMAENRGKVKRWWTLCGMSQYHRTECDRLSSCLAQEEGSARRNQHRATHPSAQRTIGGGRWFV